MTWENLNKLPQSSFANDITGEQYNTFFMLEGDNVPQKKSFNERFRDQQNFNNDNFIRCRKNSVFLVSTFSISKLNEAVKLETSSKLVVNVVPK